MTVNDQIVAIVALQMPADQINEIMLEAQRMENEARLLEAEAELTEAKAEEFEAEAERIADLLHEVEAKTGGRHAGTGSR